MLCARVLWWVGVGGHWAGGCGLWAAGWLARWPWAGDEGCVHAGRGRAGERGRESQRTPGLAAWRAWGAWQPGLAAGGALRGASLGGRCAGSAARMRGGGAAVRRVTTLPAGQAHRSQALPYDYDQRRR